jgi:hypothetical protein
LLQRRPPCRRPCPWPAPTPSSTSSLASTSTSSLLPNLRPPPSPVGASSLFPREPTAAAGCASPLGARLALLLAPFLKEDHLRKGNDNLAGDGLTRCQDHSPGT